MATKDPNKPDNANIEPESKKTENEKKPPDQPVPEMTAEEAAVLANEGEKALQDIGEEQLEPPAPFDMGGANIPAPGDVVVPFDKINEIGDSRKSC